MSHFAIGVSPDSISRLGQDFDSALMALAQRQSRCDELQKDRNRLLAQIDALSKQCTHLQTSLQDRDSKLQELDQSKRQILEEADSRMKLVHEEAKEKISLLKQEQDKLTRELERYQLQEQTDSRVQRLKQQIDLLEKQSEEMKPEIVQVSESVNRCIAFMKDVKNTMKQMKMESEVIRRQNQALEQENRELKGQMASFMGGDTVRKASRLEMRIAELEQQLKQVSQNSQTEFM